MDGFVGVHIAFLEGGIDLRLRAVNNLLQAQDNLPRGGWNGLQAAAIAGGAAALPGRTHRRL